MKIIIIIIIIIMKKKNFVQNRFGLVPKLYCEKESFLYCKAEIVLQGVAALYCNLEENCIARVALYCNGEGWAGKFCIAIH